MKKLKTFATGCYSARRISATLDFLYVLVPHGMVHSNND